MARASTPTMLPLDRFFAVLGMHPLHSNGIYVDGLPLAQANGCESPIMQHRWQNSDAIGREAIAQAIADAEARLSDYLGFAMVPQFVADERHMAPRHTTPVKTDWGYSISAGVERKDLIQADATIIYSDTDGDGYDETATITFSTDVEAGNEDQLALYYPGQLEDEWEIRPLRSVVVGSGVATITVRREQLVSESALEGYQVAGIDGTDDGAFLSTVDVYRHWLDPSQQIQFLWRGGGCNCRGATACLSCVQTGQFGCATIENNRSSIFQASPALWDAENETYIPALYSVMRPPERFRIWYRAGWRNMRLARYNVTMDPLWERAIAYFAVGFLDRPLCACALTQSVVDRWGEDLALRTSSSEGSHSFGAGKDMLGNPLGTTRGAIYAWNLAQSHRVGEAVCAM